MAVNVLIIPEDFPKDQWVLGPIVEKMMAAMNVKAKVRVCQNPRLQGVSEALKWERIEEIISLYRGMVRVFLLIVDRDCKVGRRTSLDNIEQLAGAQLAGTDRVFLAENAWQEVEVWVLAGERDLPADWAWAQVRAECDPKEQYYDAYARARGVLDAPHEGRQRLAAEAAANYPRIRSLCPEDVASLETRLRAALGVQR